MIPMLRELFQHQAWADAAVLDQVREHPDTWNHEKLRWTLHHIVMVQQAFFCLCTGQPFDMQKEAKVPEILAELEAAFRASHQQQLDFLARLDEPQVSRMIEMPWMPEFRLSVAEALLQVVMHSQNHRGQCLTLLRTLTGNAPTLDFILWVKDRPATAWASA
jgi:uncharacterized damage-inducible protein DinB